MPSGAKPNKYTNRHSDEAHQRDKERELINKQAREIDAENEKWAESDLKVLKRLEKQLEEERRAGEKELRKLQKKEQLENEDAEFRTGKVPLHIQKRERQKDLAKALAGYEKEKKAVRGGIQITPAEPSAQQEGHNLKNERGGVQPSTNPSVGADSVFNVSEGSNIENQVLLPPNVIGKRAKVLFKRFSKEHMEQVKEEKPHLRLSQYNDLIWEMWQKSPQNPFVVRSEHRDQCRMEKERQWLEGSDEDK